MYHSMPSQIDALLADYLAASHHRQGIMTAVVAALLKAWIVPRCNARIIRAYTFVGNHGSVKVFQNNG
jgi:RimJ/RimL family protein N-acetyltransferase